MAKQKKIFRSKIQKNFVRIQNEILMNDKLSWKAKGLLCFMLSRKDDWEFHKIQVQKYSTDGRDGTISAFNELIKAGYVKQKKIRDDKGKFFKTDYLVYDTPITENPFTDNPFTEKPNTDNPSLVTTQGITTEFSKTDFKKDFNSIPGNSVPGNADNLNNKSFQELWDMGIEIDANEYLKLK
jgi:hypothetical protein